MNDRSKNLRQTLLICLLLGAATFAAYWPVFHNDFITYDDPDYVTENIHVLTGLSTANVVWAFTTGHASNWHPLAWLSHMLDIQLFGLKPAGHHLTALLLHVASTLLLYAFLRRTTGASWRSALVAGLFALHPLHVESVAWVAERKDVLCAFFFMLTLCAYAAYAARARQWPARFESPAPANRQTAAAAGKAAASPQSAWGFYVLALALFALGLLSKPMLVTVPFLLLLLDFWPLRRLTVRSWSESWQPAARLALEKLPFLGLAATSSAITYLVQRDGHAVSLGLPLWPRVANTVVSYVKYLGQTVWPTHLAVFYPHPDIRYPVSNQWPLWTVLVSAAVLLSFSVFALSRLGKGSWLASGWFWFLGTLVPVIGLVQVGGQARADRYTYIPLTGIFICVAWAGYTLARNTRFVRTALAVAAVAALAICGAMTRTQVTYWKNNSTLFEHAWAVTTNNPLANENVGSDLAKAGKFKEALPLFRAAVEEDPNYAEASCSLAVTLSALGQPDEAVAACEAALKHRPWHAVTRSALGVILWVQGKKARAFEEFNEALRLNPDCAEAHYGLGTALLSEDKIEEAREHLKEAARRKPRDTEAQMALGRVLALEAQLPEAEEQFRKTLQICPTNAQAHIYLGSVLMGLGRTNDAEASFAAGLKLEPTLPDKLLEEGKTLAGQGQALAAMGRLSTAIKLNPGNPDAHEQLGLLYARNGQVDKAVSEFEQTLQLRPDAQAHYNLGLARVMQGKPEQAAAQYREAVRLKPDWATALNDLAWLLATAQQADLRNGPEAVRLAERACELEGSKEPRFWGTLDAAYAEAGRFDEAILTAEKVRGLALSAKDSALAQAAEERLVLYRKRLPYRQKTQ